MTPPHRNRPNDPVADNMYSVTANGGPGDLVDIDGMSDEDLQEINTLMRALAKLRDTERRLSEASRRYMDLSDLEMRALHYVMVAKRHDQIVTPGSLANHLGISAASTTKLLNRLEQHNHIVRRLHPFDRRAFAIEVTPETEQSARQTVGQQQARRFYSAARLSSPEREVVTRFLLDMAAELDISNVSWTDVGQPDLFPDDV